MKIAIRSYLAGSFLLEREAKTWDAIVILDSGLTPSEFVAEHARKHMYLQFDDITAASPQKIMPTLEDVSEAIEFSRDSEQLLVCCRAGQSRSAALAFVIACQLLGTKNAVPLLNARRHAPNSLIIELGAAVVDDPLFLTIFADWQVANRSQRLTDYLDEIEEEIDELERDGAKNRILKC